jgi:hypothetical protein
LRENVEPETASVPLPWIPLLMAPPAPVAELARNAVLETVTVPPNGLSMPPPSWAWLLRNLSFVTVTFARVETIMAPLSPPVLPSRALLAFSTVRP